MTGDSRKPGAPAGAARRGRAAGHAELPEPSPTQRSALEQLRVLLGQLGSANDAQDRGSPAEGARLRRTATASIRDLLRAEPFLAEVFPGLDAELGTWRLEAFGWSALVDEVEARLRHVHVDLVPWDRVAHARGRATEVPDWIAELGRDGHAAALRRLEDCLVSANGVTQATPLALRLVLGAVRFGLPRDQAAVRELVDRVGAAAARRIEAAERDGTRAVHTDWSLYREERLWPPFESAERDDALLDAWHPDAQDTLGWALLTCRLIQEHEQPSGRLAAVGPAPVPAAGRGGQGCAPDDV